MIEAPDPHPGPDEVVIAVRAAALNRLDLLQRQGPPLIPGFSLPHTPGMDISGDVAEIGAEVDGIGVGDRVLVKAGVRCGTCPTCVAGDSSPCESGQLIGGNRAGGYAELVSVPAINISRIPDGVSHVDASVVPTAYPVSWEALVVTGNIRIGETVLIHAAGSGLGVFAIQIAKRAGATVVATSRSDQKLARAAELGADVLINTAKSDLVEAVQDATTGRGVDLVFDHLGPALFMPSIRSLRYGGRMVVCGTTTGAMAELLLPALYQAGIAVLGAGSLSIADYRVVIEGYWESGIRAVVDATMALDQAAEAHRLLEGGDVFGKVVLQP